MSTGSATGLTDGLRSRLGTATERFDCCDTEFAVHVDGPRAEAAAIRARETARALEARLNAFDSDSAVAALDRNGTVDDPHVARLVERGLDYEDLTDGAFSIRYGTAEHDLKDYLRGDSGTAPDTFEGKSYVSVDGTVVEASDPVDLNGLAKGYVVDRATASLEGRGRRGFVGGGGDLSPPTGPVGIEDPWGGDGPLKVLETDLAVATSAGYRRQRGAVDHVYDPREGRLGARHDLVTVLADRDCLEADALATAANALPVDDALALLERWDGVEALVVHDGVFHRTEGFGAHVAAE
ncbi:FAD:protein FMN transferase [Halobacteriales archaeon Cl-PHB]